MDGRKLNPDQKSIVIIKSLYKGEMQEWAGNLERVDGVIDPMTRMIKLIANFKNNFIEETKPILPIGLFVEAEINGKKLEDIFMIPNSALTPNDEILFLNQDDFLKCQHGKQKHAHWNKHIDTNSEYGKKIHTYAKKNPKQSIIVQDDKSGHMVYLKKYSQLKGDK